MGIAVVQLKSGTTTIDLYRNTDGIQVRYDGWTQGRAQQRDDGTWDLVDEVMTLRVNAASHDELASKFQAIDEILRKANQYSNRSFSQVNPVWLRTRLDNESTIRQSLVFNGLAAPGYSLLGPPVSNANTLHNYKLALTRHPFWETTDVKTPIGDGENVAMNSIGGGITPSGTVYGDVPGRVSKIKFWHGVSTGNNKTEIWTGFRSDEYGTKENFEPIWDCGDADATFHTQSDGNTVRTTGVGTAKNGQVAKWTPSGTTSMNARVTVQMRNITGDISDQYGTFLVLLRARISSSGDRVYHVRMKSGYATAGTGAKWRTGRMVQVPDSGVTAGNWFFYPMGFISIPTERIKMDTVAVVKEFALRVEAKVNSGTTGNLDLDTFVLIPVAEGALHITGGYATDATTATFYESSVISSPDDELFGYNTYLSLGGPGTDYNFSLEFDAYNWSIPTGNVRLIVASQRSDQQVMTDTLKTSFEYYPRWLTMRGAE